MLIAGVITLVILVLVLGSRANDRQLTKLIGSTSTRRYDAGTLTTYNLEGEVLDPEPESRALTPYQPEPPVIRIDTSRLARAEAQPTWEASKHTPNGKPTWESNVKVPFAQAVITACAFLIMFSMLAWAFAWSWRVVAVGFGLALGVSWLWRLRLMDGLLWQIESITRTDLTGDNQIGKPEPQHAYTLANPAQARSTAAQAARSNANLSQATELLEFVNACALKGCSEAALGIQPSPSARQAYCAKRDMLISLGIGAWKDASRRKLGWQLVTTKEQAQSIITKHVMAR